MLSTFWFQLPTCNPYSKAEGIAGNMGYGGATNPWQPTAVGLVLEVPPPQLDDAEGA